VIVINGGFSFWQQYRAEETMSALQQLLPDQVRVRRDGTVVVVPSHELVPGDVIFLTAGDNVPADCRLIEAFGVRVNTASITGEARPVSRAADADPHEDVLRSRNVLLAGTSLTAGEATVLVFATGMHSAFGQIARLTQRTVDVPSPLQIEIASLSRVIALLALAIGATVFIIGQIVGLPLPSTFVFAIGVIVANVPEGLLPTVTLSMAMAARVDVGGRSEPLTEAGRLALTNAHTAMTDRGLRALAFAYRVLTADYALENVEQDLVLTALVGFEDPPRPDVPTAIRRCRDAGIKVIMVTGDHPQTASAIARDIGLVAGERPRVLTGDELRRMSDTQLQAGARRARDRVRAGDRGSKTAHR
jgi:magnesium-transporting ATPase (P-type)